MTRYVGNAHSSFPYTAVAYIEASFPDGTRVSGSGALVGRNDVLTAAHVVYDPALGGAADSVRVELGRDGASLPYGSLDGARLNYYQLDSQTAGMLSQSESEKDLALVGLDQAIGDQVGWFGLGGFQSGEVYRVNGYPGDYRDSSGPRLMEDSGYTSADPYYDLVSLDGFDISPGSSGGPIWYGPSGSPTLVGSVSTDGWATAVDAHYATLQSWISGNDDLLPAEPPPEPTEPAPETPEDAALAEFLTALDAEGWSWPSSLDDELQATEPLLDFPDLDSVIDPVVRLYTGMLGREPDLGGIEYWVAQLNAGNSLRDLAASFVASGEFTTLIDELGGGAEGSIEALYQNVLGRSSDVEGRDYWLAEFQSGQASLADMALSFTNSTEYIENSHSLVQGAKLLAWGVNLEDLEPDRLGFDMQAFAEEQRSAESLVRLYTGVLGREPDGEGFDYWLEEATGGEGLAALADDFFSSAEFLSGAETLTSEAAIEALYTNVLEREPDAAGYTYWQQQLQADSFDFGDLALSFTNSDEYRQATQSQVDDYLLEHYDGGLVGVPVDLETYLLG